MLLAALAVTASANNVDDATRSHRWLLYGISPPSPSRIDPRRSGAGVELPVDLAQVAAVEGGIDRGGGDAGVAEQLLHHAQVGAALEQVRGERVPQRVRVHPGLHARTAGVLLKDL